MGGLQLLHVEDQLFLTILIQLGEILEQRYELIHGELVVGGVVVVARTLLRLNNLQLRLDGHFGLASRS